MFGVGWSEILLVLLVALLVLGPTKLPDIAKGLGKGLREFKKAMNSLEDDDEPKRARHVADVPVTPPAEPSRAIAVLPPPSPTEDPGKRPEGD